jgi:hypothetical protein
MFTDIMNCTNAGEINGDGYVGGIVWYNHETCSLENCNNVGAVNGASAGGLVGRNDHASTIDNCYNAGIINGSGAGGIVMHNIHGSIINNSYNSGIVEGNDGYIGRLVSFNQYDGLIINSYSSGIVKENGNVGGLIGLGEESFVNNSFWDINTSGQTYSNGGTGKTTTEMLDVATYTSLATVGLEEPWNFIDTVTVNFTKPTRILW